jgi:putative nucleotidyltransferase with HDIG domain
VRVQIEYLQAGDRLLEDVFNPTGLFVMPKHRILTEDDIEKLRMHRIDSVDIASRSPSGFESGSNPQIRAIVMEAGPRFESAVKGIKDYYFRVNEDGIIEEESLDRHFEPLIDNLRKESDFVSLLLLLNTQDDYTYQHSVQVGMISYTLARWLGMSEEEARKIAKAGYLHDIGKSKIDPNILNKPASLTPKEFELVKQHTVYGHQILTRSMPDHPEFSLVAMQHHERLDGSGYPLGLKGSDIHVYSRIVSVADIYSAMISPRAYRRKRDLIYVLRELHDLSFSQLDPVIVQTFIRNMIPNFIGKRVLFKDGQMGTIVMNNPHDPFRPLVRIMNEFVDLSKRQDLVIETVFV